MSYKSILVYVDDKESCARQAEAAALIARSPGASVTGLTLAAYSPAPAYMEAAIPADLQLKLREELEEVAEETKGELSAELQKRDLPSECLMESCLDGEVADMVGLHARYHDLMVLRQTDPNAEVPQGGRSVIEDIVLSSGRPAVIVPYIGPGKTIGKKVTVAWDASREAARAVADALPLLKAADSVSVLVVNPKEGRYGHGQEPGADIARHLARHNISATVDQEHFHDITIGEAILSQVADNGSDLLVMGAYGHSRLRELILGGVTQTIFHNMTIPVFVSH